MAPVIDKKIAKAALKVQHNEVTEYFIYFRLGKICKDPHNAEVLHSIGDEELAHSKYWESKTGVTVKPNRIKVFFTVLTARIFGLTFTLKRMERNEGVAQKTYDELIAHFPEAKKISDDEAEHEQKLLKLLDEELLQYVGSIVLGLNDALVELTGALAGFTLALGGTRLISLAGLITGVSAAFSMSASDYLSRKAEEDPRAARSALYTGAAYIITVMLLILPFLFLSNKFLALGITLAAAVFIIFVFNYYLSVAKELNFRRRFFEMIFISLGVASLSFGIGFVLKNVLGVD
ncbi:MAG: VIT1/CCC1 transporter family protein [Treponema sp.]|jgi:VIT1/CCC1 family predicted Fe2+/Mn2+ transporter|nr:VIT1/CCC1 transporter family protein [Treponema sp.]